MSLKDFGFDPDKLLSKAPPEIVKDQSDDAVPNPRIQRKYNMCEYRDCFNKAVGHIGQINCCWDHGKKLEHEIVTWKKEWKFIYWKKLDKQLNMNSF